MLRLGVRDDKGFKVKGTRKRNRKGLTTEDGTTSAYSMTPKDGLVLRRTPENDLNLNDEEYKLDYFSSKLTFNKNNEDEDENLEPSTKKRRLNED